MHEFLSRVLCFPFLCFLCQYSYTRKNCLTFTRFWLDNMNLNIYLCKGKETPLPFPLLLAPPYFRPFENLMVKSRSKSSKKLENTTSMRTWEICMITIAILKLLKVPQGYPTFYDQPLWNFGDFIQIDISPG